MAKEPQTRSSHENDEMIARISVNRIAREERLQSKAAGRLWMVVLPMVFLVIASFCWLLGLEVGILIPIMLLAPIILLQVETMETNRRLDALLRLHQLREGTEPGETE